MKRASAGFSLVELMVTVAVVGIIASLATPDRASDRDRLQLVKRQLVLQELAVVLGREFGDEHDAEVVVAKDAIVAGVVLEARVPPVTDG